jgi:hypothetical protein
METSDIDIYGLDRYVQPRVAVLDRIWKSNTRLAVSASLHGGIIVSIAALRLWSTIRPCQFVLSRDTATHNIVIF